MFRTIRKEQKLHLFHLHSYSWKTGDHAHICLAARLLELDDFSCVCPLSKKEWKNIERNDICDQCQYLSILNFVTDESGKKQVIIS